MIYLTGASNPTARALAQQFPNKLGVLTQPGNNYHRSEVHAYQTWAIDNGCFGKGAATFDLDRYIEEYITEALRHAPRPPLFATAPDVVGDHVATMRRAEPALHRLRRLVPAAFVAQNGAEHDMTIDWGTFDVLFLGGLPECAPCRYVRPIAQPDRQCPYCGSHLVEWKEGSGARAVTHRARAHGKWIHMGRVNSWRRLRLATDIGCASVDGTYLAFGPSRNAPNLVRWLQRIT